MSKTIVLYVVGCLLLLSGLLLLGPALEGVLCALLLTCLGAVVYEAITRRRLASA